MAGQKRVSQTHIVSEALSNEHAKKREGKRLSVGSRVAVFIQPIPVWW